MEGCATYASGYEEGAFKGEAVIVVGQYYDEETGLHYNWHRYYDPNTGRYLSPDPLVSSIGRSLEKANSFIMIEDGKAVPISPEQFNAFINDAFIYANNNPLLYIDPTGLSPCNDCLLKNECHLQAVGMVLVCAIFSGAAGVGTRSPAIGGAA